MRITLNGITRNMQKHEHVQNREVYATMEAVCRSCVLQTSLNDECDSVGRGVDDLKRVPLAHPIRLETVDTQDPVVQLTAANVSVLVTVTLHFLSAAVAVDSSHMIASSSASLSRFSPPSNFVSGHVSTMWRWPQSQEGDWVRPHLCKFARHGPWPV